MNLLPSVTHILPVTTIQRERLLPVPGKVLVRAGQKVKASDVVAEANVSPTHLFLDVARGLGLSPEKAEELVQRSAGESVVEGDIIAVRSGMMRRVIRAPVSGKIVLVADGQVLLEVDKYPQQVTAGIPGTVTQLVTYQGAVIETTGSLVQGVWGNGQVDFGLLRVIVQEPQEVLTPDHLDVRMRGSIILAGHCDQEGTLRAASDLLLRGLILSSMAARLVRVAQKIKFPIMIVEGFGHRPMNSLAFQLLSTSDNREVALIAEPFDKLSGTRPEVIIPLPAEGMPNRPQDVAQFATGQKVRIVRAPHDGAIGTIVSLPSGMKTFPSGIRALSAVVDLEAGESTIEPLKNLEILA